MGWVRFDDASEGHPKFLRVGLAAEGLHKRAACYSSRHLTDGFVPDEWVRRNTYDLPLRSRVAVVATLLAERLFERVDGGYVVHDYLDYNPSRAQVLANRAWDTKRKELGRDPELVAAIKQRDGDRCRYCGQRVNWKDRRSDTGGTYDHVIPRGPNTLANVVVACRRCNFRKGPRTPSDAGMELLPPGQVSSPDLAGGPDRPQNRSALRPVPSPPDPKEELPTGGAMSEGADPGRDRTGGVL